METIYAWILLHLAKTDISKESITRVLKAADVKIIKENIEKMLVAIDKGINIVQILEDASKLQRKEEVEIEEIEEEEEEKEEELGGLTSLFG